MEARVRSRKVIDLGEYFRRQHGKGLARAQETGAGDDLPSS